MKASPNTALKKPNPSSKSTFLAVAVILIMAVLNSDIVAQDWDGPYVRNSENGYTAQWVNGKGEVFTAHGKQKLVGPKDASVKVVSLPEKPLPIKTSYKASKIAVMSDIHGQNTLAITLLQKHKIIDAENNWNFGDGVLMIAGDIMNRGPEVMETLWLVQRLSVQAEKEGGAVVFIIGNHEAMVLNGELGYLNKKYQATADALKVSYEKLFTTDYVLGKWLRTSPLMVKINDSLFVHAGIPETVLAKNLTMEQINQIPRDKYINNKNLSRDESQIMGSLIWYRGYFSKKTPCPEEFVDQALAKYNAKRIIVGHTSHRQIITRYSGKVICVDSSIKSGKRGELLLWQNDQWKRGLLDGTTLPL